VRAGISRLAASEVPVKRSLMLLMLVLPAVFALVFSTSSVAASRKACTELKQEIAAKIDAKGVKSYTLEVLDSDAQMLGKVVGSCDGGTKRIVYTRVDSAAIAKLN
jgi:Protein of unknown function (DUF1161)